MMSSSKKGMALYKPRPLVVCAGVISLLVVVYNYEHFESELHQQQHRSINQQDNPLFPPAHENSLPTHTHSTAEDPSPPLTQNSKTIQVKYSPGVYILPNRTLSNALHWPGDVGAVRSAADLPNVFGFDPKEWSREGKQRVCVFTRTPRQDSLFKTNILSQFGSQRYYYDILRSTDCQHNGRCTSAEDARSHPSCNGKTTATVHLLERIKCCQHDRYDQVLSNGMEYYDVLVATGDEYCRATTSIGRAHFRTYAGVGMVRFKDSPMAPQYLPLGPREEFFRVRPQHVLLVKERKYLFNFIGSVTSDSRKMLSQQLKTLKTGSLRSFVHIVQEWSKKLTRQNGYILPNEYRRVLMNSSFTLCPQGHNPEAYRIYEAAEAGSIPIVVLDKSYSVHECKCSFKPLIDSGAPFVFLENWNQLPKFLAQVEKDELRIRRMQADVMHWYSRFMRTVAANFESVLEARFQDRSENGEFTSTATYDAITTLFSDSP